MEKETGSKRKGENKHELGCVAGLVVRRRRRQKKNEIIMKRTGTKR